jgi:hypothetical protein
MKDRTGQKRTKTGKEDWKRVGAKTGIVQDKDIARGISDLQTFFS